MKVKFKVADFIEFEDPGRPGIMERWYKITWGKENSTWFCKNGIKGSPIVTDEKLIIRSWLNLNKTTGNHIFEKYLNLKKREEQEKKKREI